MLSMRGPMQPRLKSSKKWTQLPPEFTKQVETVFTQNFEDYKSRGVFKVEGRIYPAEILLRVGFLQHGRLKQDNMEISVDFAAAKTEDPLKKIHICVDAAASLFLDFFNTPEEEELDLPLSWKEFKFQDEKIYLQYTAINTDLEAEADRLLGLAEDKLLQGDIETLDEETPDEESVDFPIEEDSDEADASGGSEPKMFGEKKKNKKQLH